MKMLTSKTVSKKAKLRVYKKITRPNVTFAWETLTVTRKMEEELGI